MREFGSDWNLAIGEDEILREFGSERDFVEGEERKRKLEIERVRDEIKRKGKRIKVKENLI